MNETLEEVYDINRRNKDDGFEVPAVRMGEEEFQSLLKTLEYVTKYEFEEKWGEELEYEEAMGIVGGTEVIVDDSISGVVAEDVRGLWRDE